ncbi:MAG: UDP-N-acetylmuramoyl-L-alanyl-D-glutamate--2,6-diaminopimelate ligase [Thermoleophilia bacterium]|nr:UDP-N-acetylmuramoyl-L-alanyl-D-glutamate--2,6-diaminopimelate ligase [Thermoleophilia bacterium]
MRLSGAPRSPGRAGPLVESASIELETLSQAIGATRRGPGRSLAVADLAFDSREVRPGTLFFCVSGATDDGHAHAAEAVARGAIALVVERELDVPVPQLVVADVRRSPGPAADLFFGRPTRELTVAAVTGTNGKTTTSFLLFALLAAAGRRPGLLGTIESRVGGERRGVKHTTPEAIDLQRAFREMLDAGDRSCAMEASSHASALGRLEGTRFAALVFTNLSQDHLDLHGSMDAYYEAKRRLFVEPGPDGAPPPAAVNVGDPYGARLAAELTALGGRLVTFGLERGDVVATGLALGPRGAAFRAGGLELRTRLRGRFNVENVLGAVAAGRLLELPDDAIVRGVAHVTGVPGRLEPVEEGQPFAVLVDYAHTPTALEHALVAAREICAGRLICVFGCGGDRDRSKRGQMGAVARARADRAVLTSDNPRGEDPLAIIAEVVAGSGGEGPDLDVEPDRRRAIRRAVSLAEEGDVVVIAGKGHELGQTFAEGTVPFSDVDEARDALRRLAAGHRA